MLKKIEEKMKIFFLFDRNCQNEVVTLHPKKYYKNMLSNIKINFTDTENFTTFVGIKKVLHRRTQDKEIYGL